MPSNCSNLINDFLPSEQRSLELMVTVKKVVRRVWVEELQGKLRLLRGLNLRNKPMNLVLKEK